MVSLAALDQVGPGGLTQAYNSHLDHHQSAPKLADCVRLWLRYTPAHILWWILHDRSVTGMRYSLRQSPALAAIRGTFQIPFRRATTSSAIKVRYGKHTRGYDIHKAYDLPSNLGTGQSTNRSHRSNSIPPSSLDTCLGGQLQ